MSTTGVDVEPAWETEQPAWQEAPRPVDDEAHRREAVPLGFHTWQPMAAIHTPEVLQALDGLLKPADLDWDLLGVPYVHEPDFTPPPPPFETAANFPEAPQPPAGREVTVAGSEAGKKPAQRPWERQRILDSVRELSWDGYVALVADIFRREGCEVLAGEGTDQDVIDLEVQRADERILVNCQLRGMTQIDSMVLREMDEVAVRNASDGACIVTDGDFTPDAWAYAERRGLVLIDADKLVDLVVKLAVGDPREKKLTFKLARLVRPPAQRGTRQTAS